MVFNEGNITLDNPDFRGSSAPVLVQAEPSSLTTIRNSVLGDMNCEYCCVDSTTVPVGLCFRFHSLVLSAMFG